MESRKDIFELRNIEQRKQMEKSDMQNETCKIIMLTAKMS